MLNEKIKTYLDERGIKYSSVANGIGLPANTFSTMISGKRKIVTEEYFAICSFLGVAIDTFAPGEQVKQ